MEHVSCHIRNILQLSIKTKRGGVGEYFRSYCSNIIDSNAIYSNLGLILRNNIPNTMDRLCLLLLLAAWTAEGKFGGLGQYNGLSHLRLQCLFE